MTFEKFWTWLQAHSNCIVRAGTPDVELFDDDDFHWHFAVEEQGALLVQVIRGKKLVGELVVPPSEIAFVQSEPSAGEETLFELIVESEDTRVSAFHFVLSHGCDDEEEVSPGRFTH